MKVAILQAGQSPESLRAAHGDYNDMSENILAGRAAEFTTYRVFDGILPAAPGEYNLYIITGSPCGVYEDLPWIAPLEAFIRAAYGGRIQMIGLCFGHQILAQALGGIVEKSRKGYGLGVMDYQFTPRDEPAEGISLLAWHQDQVIAPPPNAETIMTSEFCRYAGFQYGNKVLSFQPHPEFVPDFVADLISFREGQTITAEQAKAARTSLSKTVHAA